MKRIILFVTALLVVSFSYAQGEMDALRMSGEDLTGTARAMGMGGAFGALGGDITGIAINPAGIGVYRSSEFVATMNFENVSSRTDMGATCKENKFKFNFDNIGYVGYFPTGDNTFTSFNFGVSYNRIKNFDRTYKMKGVGVNTSLADYIAIKSSEDGGIPEQYLEIPKDLSPSNDPFNFENWLSVFGYNAYLMDPTIVWDPKERTDYKSTVPLPVNNTLNVVEKGSIGSYDFNFGTNVMNFLSLGLTFSITDIRYRMNSYYEEQYARTDGFSLENWYESDGTGYNVKLGAIIRPVDALRIGVAYHSPTWYTMTDYYSAEMYDFSNRGSSSPENYNDYSFQTPYKWVFSLAGIIGNKAIVSVDYEIEDYTSMNLSTTDGSYSEELDFQNECIDYDFRMASTLRAGLEYRITPQLSARLGYAWKQTPLETDFQDGKVEVATVGSRPNFILPGDTQYGTFGLGYRFTPNFYVDVAAVFKQEKADLYAYSKIYPENFNNNRMLISKPAEFKNNTFKGLLTFGYKF